MQFLTQEVWSGAWASTFLNRLYCAAAALWTILFKGSIWHQFLAICWDLLYAQLMFTNIPPAFGNNACYLITECSILHKFIRSTWLIVIFKTSVSYSFICLTYQIVREIHFKSLTLRVDLSTVSYSFVNFYFICFKAAFVGAQNLKCFIFL